MLADKILKEASSPKGLRRARYLRQFSRRRPKLPGRGRKEPTFSLHDPGFCEAARRAVLNIVDFKTSKLIKNSHGAVPPSSKRLFTVFKVQGVPSK